MIGNIQSLGNPYIRLLIAFFIGSALMSCDPAKRILIYNNLEVAVDVKIVQDSTSKWSFTRSGLLELHLSSSNKTSECLNIYGLGVFSEEELEDFNKSIKSIIIRTEYDTCVFTGKELIDLLPKKRTGKHKSTLEVVLKKCGSIRN